MLDLSVNATTVLTYLTQIFSNIWLLLAIALALLAVPMIIDYTKFAMDRSRTRKWFREVMGPDAFVPVSTYWGHKWSRIKWEIFRR